jgi:hypothetical protein
MTNPFTEHPHSIGETYLGHAFAATRISGRIALAAAAAAIHAVLPFLFVTTTRRMILDLSDELRSGRRAPAAEEKQPS